MITHRFRWHLLPDHSVAKRVVFRYLVALVILLFFLMAGGDPMSWPTTHRSARKAKLHNMPRPPGNRAPSVRARHPRTGHPGPSSGSRAPPTSRRHVGHLRRTMPSNRTTPFWSHFAGSDVRWAKWSVLVRSGQVEDAVAELQRIAAIDPQTRLFCVWRVNSGKLDRWKNPSRPTRTP